MDLKRLYTADTPKFRRGDNVIIIFNFYDDGKEFSLSSATRAEMKQKTSNGNIITTECEFINYKGKRAVKFDVEAVAMVEKGYLNLLLTVYDGFNAISIQPFNVFIYDDYMGGADSFIDLIQELQRLIENMILDMNNAIKLSEKGVPNGVATLDGNGKVPLIQMPDEFNAFIEHIAHTFYKDGVHGLRIDEDGNAMYKDDNRDWHYMGTGGGSHTEILNAEIKVVDSIATVTWEGVPTAVIRKWALGDRNIQYFLLDGNSFTGNTFTVSSIGIHTLYYRDSNGIDCVKTFEVDMSMMNRPNVDIDVDDGYVTVTPPTGLGITIKKWSKGSRNVAYFQFNGTVFTGNTFQVTEVGTYTVYIKTTGGLEYVYEFEVTKDMLPVVSRPVILFNSLRRGSQNEDVFTFLVDVIDPILNITGVKKLGFNDYTNLHPVIPSNKLEKNYSMGSIDFSLSSNRNKEFVCGFENSDGIREEITFYADNDYVYYWIDKENVVLADVLTSSIKMKQSVLEFPSLLNGKKITEIGQPNENIIYYNTTVEKLTIPLSIERLHPIFHRASELKEVIVLNPSMSYMRATFQGGSYYAFIGSINEITMKSTINSTTKTFVQNIGALDGYTLVFQSI